MKNNPKKLTAISLFTGAGGLDLGFEAAGFDVKLAVDNMPESCETLRFNKPEKAVFGPPHYSGDVNDLTPAIIQKLTGLKPGQVDMMIGGPPCQTFSMAAAQRFLKSDEKFKRKGFDCDEKGQLIFRYTELIIAMKPKAFLIENVPGILDIDGGSGIAIVYERLTEAGYTLSTPFVLDAKNFGVPQNRRRAFVIGTLNGTTLNPPQPTHGRSDDLFPKDHTSVAQAIYDLAEGSKNHECRDHKEESVERYKTLKFGQREKLGRVDRLDPLKPSKTVIAGGSAGGGRSHLHPYIARTMSVRECARLQTFPDDYIFIGKNGRQFTQVGNAVPPLLAEVLGKLIAENVFGIKTKKSFTFALPDITKEEANEILMHKSIREHFEMLYNDVLPKRSKKSSTKTTSLLN